MRFSDAYAARLNAAWRDLVGDLEACGPVRKIPCVRDLANDVQHFALVWPMEKSARLFDFCDEVFGELESHAARDA